MPTVEAPLPPVFYLGTSGFCLETAKKRTNVQSKAEERLLWKNGLLRARTQRGRAALQGRVSRVKSVRAFSPNGRTACAAPGKNLSAPFPYV